MVIILHLNELKYVVITRFSRYLLWVKTILDHRTCILGKPLKNHQCQWSIWEKTFNGDGPVVAKPLKNHRRQWCSVKKHYHPIVWEKWPSLKSTAVQCSSTRPANSHDGVLSAPAIWWREMAPWFDPDYHRNADESNDIISTMRLCWISRQHGGEIVKVLGKSTNSDWNQAWTKICKKRILKTFLPLVKVSASLLQCGLNWDYKGGEGGAGGRKG